MKIENVSSRDHSEKPRDVSCPGLLWVNVGERFISEDICGLLCTEVDLYSVEVLNVDSE